MQPTPATSGNHAGVYPSDAQQAASSTSVIPAMPVLRAGTPQQALLRAVGDGDTTAVRKLLANGGVNLNDVDPDTRLMPLMLASRQGHDDVALVLTRGTQVALHQASPCLGASASPSALPRLDGNNGTCPSNSGALPAFRAGKPGSPLAVSKWELLEARSLARLVADGKLKLGGPLSQEKIDELAHMLVSPHGELTDANLNDADVDAAIMTLLLEEMKRNETLVSLELGSNKMGDAGASSLSTMLKVNRTLNKLDLRGNKISATGAGWLWEVLENKGMLTKLKLV